MNNDRSQSVMEIMNNISGVELREKHGGSFKFIMYLTGSMSDTTIDELDLSQRSSNSLKRAGFKNIGDVANALSSGISLKNIRNCGTKSAREIMEKLFLYQYNSLEKDKREEYLAEVVLINNLR